MEVLERFSDSVEQAGLDEAYLDLSGSLVPLSRARELKQAMRERTRLTCSVGLAPNKLLAKIASDLDKPDGLSVLRPEEMLGAVGERRATLIPGVGPRTAERLDALGIRTVAELAGADAGRLQAALGPRLGRELQERASGNDSRPLETERRRKSESRETTFDQDVTDPQRLASVVDELARSVCDGLEDHGYEGRTVTLKIRLRPFKTHTRSRTLSSPTRDPDAVSRVARELLERFAPEAPVRLIGVGVAGLGGDEAESESGPARAASVSGGAPTEPLTLDVG